MAKLPASKRGQNVSKPMRDTDTERKATVAREDRVEEGDGSGDSDVRADAGAGALGAETTEEERVEYIVLDHGAIINGVMYPRQDDDVEEGKEMIVELTPTMARVHTDHGVRLLRKENAD